MTSLLAPPPEVQSHSLHEFTLPDPLPSAPDGYSREMLIINGQFPGPLIEANEGDTIVVNVHNTMSTGTGIRKRLGPSNITICVLIHPSIPNRLA